MLVTLNRLKTSPRTCRVIPSRRRISFDRRRSNELKLSLKLRVRIYERQPGTRCVQLRKSRIQLRAVAELPSTRVAPELRYARRACHRQKDVQRTPEA